MKLLFYTELVQLLRNQDLKQPIFVENQDDEKHRQNLQQKKRMLLKRNLN